MRAFIAWVASGFGLGFSPVAPGTVGALPGLALAFAFSRFDIGLQIAAAVLLAALAIPICDVAEKRYGKKDDRRIVADEFMTFPLCTIGLPATPLAYGIAFLVSRACDVVKPPPAHALQRLTGGLGVVVDDVIAMLYALAINHAALWALRQFGWA
jgi:phosphatidylglycerophosphatase A